jgi:glyoxylase-like metal-dependent hydrolase (beta-lactamase superfamily II)
MRWKSLSVLMLTLTCDAALGADARKALEQAMQALGATQLKTLEFSGSGHSFALGQAPAVDSPWPRFNDVSHTRVVSFDPWATRLDRVRTQGESPPRGGGGQPIFGEQKQTQAVAAGTPAAATVSDDLAALLPQAFVKAAAQASDLSAQSATRDGKKYTVLSYTARNKATTRGWLNDRHLIDCVETTLANVVLGDVKVETTFSGYKDFAGVLFPTRIEQRQAGHPVLDLNVSSVKANVPTQIKAETAAAVPPTASELLGPGVYLVTGGYAAIAIDFKDHITIIEGGQNDQRSLAVIEEVKRLIPGKPITELVNTHPHFDHTGGVRAYVAEGATIVTHARNVAYFKRILANPHTLAPDRLATNPRTPSFKAVDDKLTLSDGERTVELHHLRQFGHHDGAVVAYFPKEKILVQADAFNPPPAPITKVPSNVNPYHVSLLANIERLNLTVDRIIPVHLPADSRTVTLSELRLAAGRAE